MHTIRLCMSWLSSYVMMLCSKTMDKIYVDVIWGVLLLQVLHLLPFIFAYRNLWCINKICGEASTKFWLNIEPFLKSVMIIYKKHAYQFFHDYLGPPKWIVYSFKLIVVNKSWECNDPFSFEHTFFCFVFFRVHSKPWNNIHLFPCRLSIHLNSMCPSSP